MEAGRDCNRTHALLDHLPHSAHVVAVYDRKRAEGEVAAVEADVEG